MADETPSCRSKYSAYYRFLLITSNREPLIKVDWCHTLLVAVPHRISCNIEPLYKEVAKNKYLFDIRFVYMYFGNDVKHCQSCKFKHSFYSNKQINLAHLPKLSLGSDIRIYSKCKVNIKYYAQDYFHVNQLKPYPITPKTARQCACMGHIIVYRAWPNEPPLPSVKFLLFRHPLPISTNCMDLLSLKRTQRSL